MKSQRPVTSFKLNGRKVLRLVAILAILTGGIAVAQQGAKKKTPKARYPKFDSSETERIFFSDVFSNLRGSRPDNLSRPLPVAKSGGSAGTQATEGSPAGGVFTWSKLITPAALENEVKALKLSVDKSVDKPTQFRGRGYLQARQHFSLLSLMFAVAGEYDGKVRWQETAPIARDVFARTAANCKVGTPQSYNDAKLRKQELQDLLAGGSVDGKSADRKVNWENLVDRSPLMQRLKLAENERMMQWSANKQDFESNLDKIAHEAQLVALIAEVLTREGMLDAGDETYDGYARTMQKSALTVVEATKLKNHEMARRAVAEINKSCGACHGDYQ